MEKEKLAYAFATQFFPELIKYIEGDQEHEDSDAAERFYADLGEKLKDLVQGSMYGTMDFAVDSWNGKVST